MRVVYNWNITLVHRRHRTQYSVFHALSIGSGLVAAVLLCMKREVSEDLRFFQIGRLDS